MKYLYKIFKISVTRFYNDNYFYHVAALTYVTLLGIVPFFAIVIFFFTKLTLFNYFVTSASKYILTTFIPTSAISINTYFQKFIQQALKLPIFNILFFLILSIMLIATIQDTLNDIWKVKKKSRSLLQWLFAFIILFITPILIGLSSGLTSYFISLIWIQHTATFLKITDLLIILLSILVNIFIFSMIYVVIPNIKVKLKQGLTGAIVASCLFEMAKITFALYINHFHSYQLIYGNFAIFPIFLLWLYICWIIILFGGIISWSTTLTI